MQAKERNYSYYRTGAGAGSRLRIEPPKKQPRRRPSIKTILIIGLFVAISTFAKFGPSSGNDGHKGSAAAAQVQTEPPKKTVDTSTLATTLAQTIKRYPYDTSVSVIELNSGKVIQTGDTYPFLAASTTKLMTAMLYLSDVEQGHEKLTTDIGGKPAKEQLQLMINKSDNTAWKLLNDHLSKDSLADYAKSKGLTSYDPVKNTVTSNDIASLLAKLYKRELINDEHTKLLLGWMQNTSEERFIPPSVPQGVKVHHKSGYLEDRVHDVAIIDNGSMPFVLVIYSKAYQPNYDYVLGQKLFSQVTTTTLKTFSQ